LAGGGHRQRIDELNLARVFVGRKKAADMILYLLNKIFRWWKSWLKHDEGLDYLAARLVGLADHRGVRDRGMLHEAGFDFGRADAVAGGLDHVVRAPLVPEVAV